MMGPRYTLGMLIAIVLFAGLMLPLVMDMLTALWALITKQGHQGFAFILFVVNFGIVACFSLAFFLALRIYSRRVEKRILKKDEEK